MYEIKTYSTKQVNLEKLFEFLEKEANLDKPFEVGDRVIINNDTEQFPGIITEVSRNKSTGLVDYYFKCIYLNDGTVCNSTFHKNNVKHAYVDA